MKRVFEIVGDFFFNEIVDSIISTYVWKGFWDMLLYLTQLFDKHYPNNYEISILTVLAIGFSMYLMIVLYQSFYLSTDEFKQANLTLKIFIMESIYFLAFFSIICIWFSIWTLYDKYTLVSNYKFYIVFSTHFLSVIFLSTFRVVNSLYGPATLDMQPEDFQNYNIINDSTDNEENEYVRRYNNDMYHIQYSDLSLFRISYFSKS